MTANILSAELTALLLESKRKLPELRTAADQSLQDLKSLPSTSEAQLRGDLSRRPRFIEPFLIAALSKAPKCVGPGLDVQLKVLQALPPLLQNYPDDIRGVLLFTLLQTCSILQTSKTSSVSSTATATLQQLFSSLFEKLNDEDAKALEFPTIAEVPGDNGLVSVRSVAYDTFRVFQDLVLMTTGEKPQHVRFSPMTESASLELVEAILVNHAERISTHPELAQTIRATLLPFLISTFSEKKSFSTIVRVTRLLYLIVRNHLDIFPTESESILDSFNHVIEQGDVVPGWKKVLCMEVFRGIFAEPSLILRAYAVFDEQKNGKPIIRSCTANFVRLASEKPALIGMSQQSTVPVGNYFQREANPDPSTDSNSMAGAEGTAGVSTASVPGISNQWSSIRIPCIDQLDKPDAPSLPETYIYSLVLSCLVNLAESLAKFILPLTVQHASKSKKTGKAQMSGIEESPSPIVDSTDQARSSLKRSHSYKKRSVPVNPLLLVNHPALDTITTAAKLVDDCWPAILASCSTFFYASLDSERYRALVRAFQKFAQVAGLLRMSTPRDAFLTTLGKAAVPSHVLAGTFTSPSFHSAQSPNPGKGGFMNVENLVSQAVSQASTLLPDRGRRTSIDSGEPTLSSRNLLCLRALLNLAIALGPTLDSSWSIIFETLQQADKVMASSSLKPIIRQGSQTTMSSSGEPPHLQVIASEVNAIQAAVSRLFESTVDFPNEPFVQVLRALCLFVGTRPSSEEVKSTPPPTPGGQHRRAPSFSRSSTLFDSTDQDYIFALSKIRELVSSNVERFTTSDPAESGWDLFISTTTAVAVHRDNPSTARLLAGELLSRLTRDIINFSGEEEPAKQNEVQSRSLAALLLLCNSITRRSHEADDTANEVYSIVLETLRAILEQTGDALKDGWTSVFRIVGSVFESTQTIEESPRSSLCTVSLGRSAFGSVQLICSDFLSSVPGSYLLTLVETIYHFGNQIQDLNISLTSSTLFWKLSDLLFGQTTKESLDELSKIVHQGSNNSPELMGKKLQDYAEKESKPALWIILLRRVSDMTTDPREEVRLGATHTILRIFDNHGDNISSDAWQLCLWSILLPMLRSNADIYHSLFPSIDGPYPNDLVSVVKGHIVTSKVMLEGSSKLISGYLPAIVQCSQFQRIWQRLMEILVAYLECHMHDLNAAVYVSLTELLSNVPEPRAIGGEAVQQAAGIWARHFPESKPHLSSFNANQEALEAYTQSLKEVYRLTKSDIKPEAITRIAENLELAVRRSKLPSFSSDVDSLTKLQKEVLGCLSMLRTDLKGGPATICRLLARFIGMPFDAGKGEMESTGLTFVAFSKASMELSSTFIAQHASCDGIFEEESLPSLLANLELPIGLKYQWAKQGKTPCLWRKATSTLLIVLEHTIPRIFEITWDAKQSHNFWETIVKCGRGLTRADVDSAPSSTPIFEDEDFDVFSLIQFNNLIIPALGSTSIPDTTRRNYTRALFESSLIHAVQDGEIPDLSSEPLKDLYNIRFGKTYDPNPNVRGVMAYQALDDLIFLIAKHDSSPPRIKLAQAAAPYLILRAALPLKSYIADQPLRGKYMPQPQSEREELLYVLRRMTDLITEPKAIPEADGVKSDGRRHLMRLYPLVVKVLDVAGRTARPDGDVIGAAKELLDIVGEEFKI
ncbi:hypothetical protein FKW77_006507 [Venturia effusa]|uniref:Endosomal peripheral membrane protein n=1 Tax=Venturia effusa TaxID=50376 RepID=A0A517LFP1_9PEZI|nr:hypothetical protein FKW77_006507 [Venturia effusa]